MSDNPLDPPVDEPKPDFSGQVDPLENALDAAGVGEQEPTTPPVYRKLPESRLPVSSKRGSMWKGRKDNAIRQMSDLVDAWDEAIRYYNHDQAEHRDGTSTPGHSGNRLVAKRLNERHSSTENIVFSNVNAQIPELYAKNPIISVTSQSAEESNLPHGTPPGDSFARAIERLINILFAMKAAPGVNIKPKAKRNVLVTLLTNRSWFEVGYITRDKSSEQAMQNLVELSKVMQEAKDAEELRETEGELAALEEKVEFLQPSGPFVRIRLPHQVLVDPDHNDPYLSDANWVMIEDMLPTSYINAVYAVEDEGKEEFYSVFEPTHVLNSSAGDGTSDEMSLFTSDKNNYSAYGFDSQDSYDQAKRTKIWYVWDKVTRRLEMYADNDWKWPIWVWDDPYGLQNFFPLTPMWFHDNPVAVFAKGEVSYYLDQQDQINEINDEKRRALLWARRNIFYNPDSGITQEIADSILKGPDATAVPIRLPEGADPNKVIFSIPPPSMAFGALFEKKDLYQSVDRIAATNEVERGGEFKTNTTNKAIDYYSTMGNQRMDMRLDAIEDALGDVGWKLAQLCLKFMDPQTVSELTGIDVTDVWRPLDNLKDFSLFSVAVVGGSTQKLTSQGRKQAAVQIGQILAQFAKVAPGPVLKTTLTMFSKAFDDFMISKEDWDSIEQSVERSLVAGQGGAPGQPPGAPPPQGAPPGVPAGPQAPSGPPPSGGGAPPVMQIAQMAVQALSQMPPQMLKGIGMALAQGVPPAQILQQVLQQVSGQQPPPGAPQAPPGPQPPPPPPPPQPNGAMPQ